MLSNWKIRDFSIKSGILAREQTGNFNRDPRCIIIIVRLDGKLVL